jgi:hypothetical protein
MCVLVLCLPVSVVLYVFITFYKSEFFCNIAAGKRQSPYIRVCIVFLTFHLEVAFSELYHVLVLCDLPSGA